MAFDPRAFTERPPDQRGTRHEHIGALLCDRLHPFAGRCQIAPGHSYLQAEDDQRGRIVKKIKRRGLKEKTMSVVNYITDVFGNIVSAVIGLLPF